MNLSNNHRRDRYANAIRRWAIFAVAMSLGAIFCNWVVACENCGEHGETAASASWVAKWDYLSNYGRYMPRTHCLLNEAGAPDWPWITALIALSSGIVIAYTRIFIFWMKCYFAEEQRDRSSKLWDLALIFLMCAVCGYGLNILIFFWPVYRLLAVCLLVLNIASWRFAWNLKPFQKSFTSIRLERELAATLQEQNKTLAAHNRELAAEREALRQANRELAAAQNDLLNANNDLSERNKELDDFAYVASHDLKAPLRAIDNLARWVNDDVKEVASPSAIEDLQLMQSRVHRMEGLLDDLLDYSRAGRKKYESSQINVLEFVAESCEVVDLPATMQLKVSGDDFEIKTQLAPLAQVLRNLVDNAHKHHDRQTGSIAISVHQINDLVEFIVEDDGPGISHEYHARIFEMFRTLKPRDDVEGSGMGLAIVRKQIESHGGAITVTSQGRGTRFRFTWPNELSLTTQGQP